LSRPALLQRIGVGAVVLLLLAAALLGWALGPGAAPLVDRFGDGAPVWRLGRLQLDGVHGPHIGALSVQRLGIRDARGEWLRAENAAVRWRPWALLHGKVRIEFARVERVLVARRPYLRPPPSGRKFDFAVQVDQAVAQRLRLAPGLVLPEAVVLGASGSLRYANASVQAGGLRLMRLDAPSDQLLVHYDPRTAAALTVQVDGAPGGAFAAVMRLPAGEGVQVRASAQVRADGGELQAQGAIGTGRVLQAQASWGSGAWRGEAMAQAAAIPLLAPVAARLGGALRLTASGELATAARMPTFRAALEAPNLRARLEGALAKGAARLARPATLSIETDALGILLAAPGLGGRATFDGQLDDAQSRRGVRGALRVEALQTQGVQIGAEGPLSLSLRPDAYAAETELLLQARGAGAAARALASARLVLSARYDREHETLYLRRLRFLSPLAELEASGALPRKGRISGRWAVPALGKLAQGWRGAVRGRFTLSRNGEADGIGLEVNGAARGLGGNNLLAALLGANPSLEAKGVFRDGEAFVQRAVLRGLQLRAGLRGTAAPDALDLRLEASLQGPLHVGGAEIAGALDVSGQVSGAASAPRIELAAHLDALQVAALELRDAALRLQLSGGAEQRGVVMLDALLNGQSLMARSPLSLSRRGLALSALEVDAGRVRLSGDLLLGARGPSGRLAVRGALGGLLPGLAGEVEGQANLSANGSDQPRLDAVLKLAGFRAGSGLRLRTARLAVAGVLRDLRFDAAATGVAGGQPLELRGSGEASLGEAGLAVQAALQGAFAGVPVRSREPVRIFTRDGFAALADLALGEGGVQLRLQHSARRLEGSLRLSEAPLALVSGLARNPLAGDVSGLATLSGAGGMLQGEADFRVRGARFEAHARDPVDADLKATLQGEQLRATLNARSRDGLTLAVAVAAPMRTGVSPLRLAQGAGAVTADWRVQGPIGGLWDLLGGLDQDVVGDVKGEGRARFGAPGLSGEGRLILSNGRVEDRVSGLHLQDLTAILEFDPQGARLSSLSAKSPGGGRITGTGALQGARAGVLRLNLQDVQILDRPDGEATAAGDVQLQWSPEGSLLSGAITITAAELRLDALRDAGPAALDVVEINRPGDPPELAAQRIAAARAGTRLPEPGEDDAAEAGETLADAIPAFGAGPRLALRVSAPRRIFTRGQGLDGEWALDLRVGGVLAEPQLFGVARLLRGSFSLAGRTFDFERGVLTFDGDPAAALVDLYAETATEDLTVGVRIAGSPTDPDITLTSNPALPEDEILPQLLFGSSTAQLTPLQAAQLASSLAALAGRSSFDLVSTTRELIRLDRLDVRQEAGGVYVAGGRYVTENVYLELSRGALGVGATKVEWRVRPKLFIVSSFLTNGDQRLSVRWRRDLGRKPQRR